jgi:hypothetical protein
LPQSSTVTYGGTIQLDLDTQLDRALELMKGDPLKASQLFLRWAESDSEIHALIPPVVEDYIRRRAKARAKKGAK